MCCRTGIGAVAETQSGNATALESGAKEGESFGIKRV